MNSGISLYRPDGERSDMGPDIAFAWILQLAATRKVEHYPFDPAIGQRRWCTKGLSGSPALLAGMLEAEVHFSKEKELAHQAW
ncbi:hypothetical protein llap_10300 [Limosa lapponica baueri]|uniref:Uncharacterized protein n=1 Tax=Limosa lapponica baueri TaxID=1758121 RepID=A0A2I0TZX6_LIMLA|nr:hypothetical protein llap_10300 [Limosa lapponica baueri]